MQLEAIFVDHNGRVRALWRVAFFVVTITLAATIATSIMYAVISALGLGLLARDSGAVISEFGQLIGVIVGTYVTLRTIDRAQDDLWSRVGLGASGLRRKPMLIGLTVGTLAILIPCVLLLAAGRFSFVAQPSEPSWLRATWGALVVLVPAAFAEELIVRGYLLTALIDGGGKWFAVIATSLIFAALHLLNPQPTVISTALVALAGVFLATVRLSTGSLWAASIAHLAWNLVQAVVLHAPVSGLPVATPGYQLVDHGPIWLTGGAWGPEGGLAAAAGMLVATFLLNTGKKSAETNGT